MYPARRYLTEEEVKLCDTNLTDEVYVYQKFFLLVFQYVGTAVMTRRENGTFVCDWLSFSFCYSLLFLACHIYFVYVATVERLNLMNKLTNQSFDEDLFLYTLYVVFLFMGLAFTCFAESKKLVAYYNLLSFFQVRYYHIKGKRLDLKLHSIYKYIYPLFALSVFLVLIVLYVIVIRLIYNKLEGDTTRPLIENIIACGFILMDILSLHMLLLTNFAFLYRTAAVLVDEIQEAFKSGRSRLVEDYEKLWIDFMYVTRQFGRAVSYSVGYYFILAIFATTFELFLAIREEYTIVVVFGASIWFSLMLILTLSSRLTYKLTDNLKFLLIDTRKGVSFSRKQKLNKFFRLIRYCDCSISLAGFANLNYKLASSILKTITTFIIILLQFKQVDKMGNAERR